MDKQIFKKSYLIEFCDMNAVLRAAFTFSTPPESEELAYTQRKTETKTFGGLHVDEYGTDAVKISLSGSTINQSLKRIYRPNETDEWLSGEDEIYTLRDLITSWRHTQEIATHQGKIFIYDLSKFTGIRDGMDIDNCWQAFPGDFKIRRSSDRPFTYKYTFEFTGIPIKDFKRDDFKKKLPAGSEALGLCQKLAKATKDALGFMNTVGSAVDDALSYANQINESMTLLEKVTSGASNVLMEMMDSVGNVATGTIGGAASMVRAGNAFMNLPRTVQLKALDIGLKVQNATNGLVKATAEITKNTRDMFHSSSGYWKVPEDVLAQFEANSEEFKYYAAIIVNETENAVNHMGRLAKTTDAIQEIIIGSDESGEAYPIITYGDVPVVLKSTDTLESLAMEYFGDPGKAIDIAIYNDIVLLSEIPSGSVIKMPITNYSARGADNLIYAPMGKRDNYGRDILLSDDGSPVMSGVDFKLVGGADNLSQAILIRLRESSAKRIRLNAYGIKTNISDPTAGTVYIISSIKRTVESDPRVASVDGMKFRAERDYLDVQVFYSDINKNKGTVAGRI